MTSLELAKDLASKGLKVFPILGKKPSICQFQHLATDNHFQLEKWFGSKKFSNHDVGIHCIGILVIDIDGIEGENYLNELRKTYPIPDTLKIISGNSEPYHYQLIYKLPENVRAIPRPLKKVFPDCRKIDIKGSGGMVVGPGSRHRTGGTYTWEVEPKHISEATIAPEWMIDKLCGPEKYGKNFAQDDLPDIGSDQEFLNVIISRYPISPGNRNHQIGRAVSYLLSRRIEESRVKKVAYAWLAHYRGGSDSDNYSKWQEDIDRTLKNTVKNIENGDFELMPDHQELSMHKELSAESKDWFHKLCYVDGSKYSRFTTLEHDFILSLLIHANYEVSDKEDKSTIFMTHRQIINIYEKVTKGKKLGWKSFYNLFSRFVSRAGKKAAAIELMECVEVGTIGKASVYSLSKILGAFHDDEARDRNDTREGESVGEDSYPSTKQIVEFLQGEDVSECGEDNSSSGILPGDGVESEVYLEKESQWNDVYDSEVSTRAGYDGILPISLVGEADDDLELGFSWFRPNRRNKVRYNPKTGRIIPLELSRILSRTLEDIIIAINT